MSRGSTKEIQVTLGRGRRRGNQHLTSDFSRRVFLEIGGGAGEGEDTKRLKLQIQELMFEKLFLK